MSHGPQPEWRAAGRLVTGADPLGLRVVAVGSLYALTGYLAISLFRILLYVLEPKNE